MPKASKAKTQAAAQREKIPSRNQNGITIFRDGDVRFVPLTEEQAQHFWYCFEPSSLRVNPTKHTEEATKTLFDAKAKDVAERVQKLRDDSFPMTMLAALLDLIEENQKSRTSEDVNWFVHHIEDLLIEYAREGSAIVNATPPEVALAKLANRIGDHREWLKVYANIADKFGVQPAEVAAEP